MVLKKVLKTLVILSVFDLAYSSPSNILSISINNGGEKHTIQDITYKETDFVDNSKHEHSPGGTLVSNYAYSYQKPGVDIIIFADRKNDEKVREFVNSYNWANKFTTLNNQHTNSELYQNGNFCSRGELIITLKESDSSSEDLVDNIFINICQTPSRDILQTNYWTITSNMDDTKDATQAKIVSYVQAKEKTHQSKGRMLIGKHSNYILTKEGIDHITLSPVTKDSIETNKS